MKTVLMVCLAASLLAVGSAQQERLNRLAELEREAQRLSVVNALPQEARVGAVALLERREALQQDQEELELARLEAYVEALREGENVTVAREIAAQAVAEQRLTLLRETAQLQEDIAAFIEEFPTAARLFQPQPVQIRIQRPMQPGGATSGPVLIPAQPLQRLPLSLPAAPTNP